MQVISRIFFRPPLHAVAACVISVSLLAGAGAAYALDPLTLILLRIVRDRVVTAGLESAYDKATTPSAVIPAPGTRLPMGLDDAGLKRLIDEGFVHLTLAQRQEVFEATRQILRDPGNVNIADSLVAELAGKTSAVRQAHDELRKLTPERKRQIAQEARSEYEKMAPESREELASAIRARMIPMPSDLTDMILAEFDRSRDLSATNARQ